jgi:hypothetical protein
MICVHVLGNAAVRRDDANSKDCHRYVRSQQIDNSITFGYIMGDQVLIRKSGELLV